MAYARVWTKANPPGGQAANTADDEIRNLREDIEQRMATLVGGWTTGFTSDPITVNPEILGNVAGKSQTIHHGAFRPGNTGFAVNITDLYLESNDGVSMDVHAPLLVPAGCTLVTVSFLVNRNGGGNITGSLRYNDFTAAPATTTVGTVTTASNGIQIINTSGMPVAVIGGRTYFLKVVLPNAGARLYGAQVVYNTPDCRNTL